MTPTRRYLDRLFLDAAHVELRHQTGSRWETTWHRDADSLLAKAHRRANGGNLFTSLNHVAAQPVGPLVNDHVDRYCRLLFDFDPARPAGVSSTDAELAEAMTRAEGLARHLSGHGWPVPAVAMSGNGAHLQFRVALPNNAEAKEQLAALYAGLHRRFDDDVVHFDRAVRNPGRICALYGTVKRKGQPTEERPHRQSWIRIPQDWRQVTQQQVAALAERYAAEARAPRLEATARTEPADWSKGAGDYATLDVVAWFAAHDAYVGHITGNIHGVRCPWSTEHTTASPASGSDTIIFEGDGRGWPGFHCKHGHCEGRNFRDVIALWGDADDFCARAFRKEVAA